MTSFRHLIQFLMVVMTSLSASAQSATSVWTLVTGYPLLASPSIEDDGTIYVGSYDRKLYSIHPSGTTNWTFEMPGTNSIGFVYRGIHSSPAIGPDGTIYFGGENGVLYAVDHLSGSNLWTFNVAPTGTPAGGTRFSAIYSDPAVDSDGIIYIGSYVVDGAGPLRTSQSHLFALNPNGTVRWQYKPAETIFSDPAIAQDGAIYFGCDDGNLYALNTNGTLRWNFTVNGAIYSSASIGADGTIYFGSDDTNFYALNADGSLRWSVSMGGKVQSSAAMAADGTIYVGCNDGNLYALDASGSNLWFFATTNYVYSSPTITPDGNVIVGSADNNLYAIESGSTSTLAKSVWPMFRHNLRRTGTTQDSDVIFSPEIQSIIRLETGFEVIWSAVPGMTYQLLYRTNLNQVGWIELDGDVEATGTSASKTDTSTDDGQRYYRVLNLY